MNRGPETKTQVKERMKQRRVHIDESNYEYIGSKNSFSLSRLVNIYAISIIP